MRSFVPSPNTIAKDPGNRLRGPLIQNKRSVTEIKVRLIDNFGTDCRRVIQFLFPALILGERQFEIYL